MKIRVCGELIVMICEASGNVTVALLSEESEKSEQVKASVVL